MTSLKPLLKEHKWLWSLCALAGVFVGLGLYTAYASRAWSYASDAPAACVNCHVMGSYYQAWARSSHKNEATCNDCHVPHDSVLKKYAFKAVDGLYHAGVFTARGERQAIRARSGSSRVILQNCVRCHTQLVTEFTKMNVDYKQVLAGNAKACWDCHPQMPHTNISNTASVILAGAPTPTNL
jgi:cytochrome c nitrite reductase small subunit